MSEQGSLRVIENKRMAITLLQVLLEKEIINQPTFEKTHKKYKERRKEAA